MKKLSQFLVSVLLLAICSTLSAQAQSVKTRATTRVAIVLYPGVELLDFAGQLEVFNLMKGTKIFTIATQSGPMRIMQNVLTVTPDYTVSTVPPAEILGRAGRKR